MVSFEDVVATQLSASFRDEDGEKAVEEAVDKAVETAAGLRSRGDWVTRGELEKHLNALLLELDHAMTYLASAWRDFEKVTKIYVKRTQRSERALCKLEEFMKTKYRHDRATGQQKQLIRELAAQLKPLQDQHTLPHPDKTSEKAAAVANGSTHDDGQEILRETTYFSTMKQSGLERWWGPHLAQTEHDLLTAGKELADMLCVEGTIRRRAKRAVGRCEAASWQLQAAGRKHDRARLRAACSMEAIAAFAKVLRLANPVGLARMSVRWSVRLYRCRPDKGYQWACRFVREVVARAEAAATVDDDVEERVRELMEVVLRVEEGRGKGEEGGKSEGGDGGGSKRKAKGKGKGKGKK
ncbi:MAG: hypothetical protein Q9173_001266 [Seirophora scorigena]